jgi:hypothetical protein
MIAEWTKEIPNWEKEYTEMMQGLLTKRQIELLDGAEIKSHEGMVFGGMYSDWKKRKGYDVEENVKSVNTSEDPDE